MKQAKNGSRRYRIISQSLLYMLPALSLLFLWLAPAAAAKVGTEDGPAENITALLMLAASVIMLIRGLNYYKINRQIGAVAILIAAAFFVFAGEEISWGQRLLSIETSDFMQQYNWQGETNLHNLHTDISNVAFHYGALIFLIIAPLFYNRLIWLTKKLPQLSFIERFIAPSWTAAPSFVLLGMLDSRFIFIIEDPRAAAMYLLALAVGLVILTDRLIRSIRSNKNIQAGLLGLSLLLIAFGIYISYVYAVDEQATNIISEFKELFIAFGLFLFALQWRGGKEKQHNESI